MGKASIRNVSLVVLVGLAMIMGLVLVYSDQGLMRLDELRQEQERLTSENDKLREENRRLIRQIERIKSDPRYIEDEARKKLGLVRPDEEIYRLEEETEQTSEEKTTP